MCSIAGESRSVFAVCLLYQYDVRSSDGALYVLLKDRFLVVVAVGVPVPH